MNYRSGHWLWPSNRSHFTLPCLFTGPALLFLNNDGEIFCSQRGPRCGQRTGGERKGRAEAAWRLSSLCAHLALDLSLGASSLWGGQFRAGSQQPFLVTASVCQAATASTTDGLACRWHLLPVSSHGPSSVCILLFFL